MDKPQAYRIGPRYTPRRGAKEKGNEYQSINSLLSSLNPSYQRIASRALGGNPTLPVRLPRMRAPTPPIQDAVNAILNSATNTAGSGIDVTSTVDAILQIDAAPEVNLQSQVTALNTQTSALQTIENDLTALQTSVQALSDPTGAFSDVTVTSSNNDVVSAMAANGTAVGSHSIMVSSLATTSAEYSAPQTSSTSTLPTGTLEIQVGSNTAVAIPVDSSDDTDTLSGLVSYINNKTWVLPPRSLRTPPEPACRWSAKLPARREP